MKFNFIDKINGSFKEKEWAFIIPAILGGSDAYGNNLDSLYSSFVEIKEVSTLDIVTVGGNRVNRKYASPLAYGYDVIIAAIEKHKQVITMEPNAEAVKAIKAILKHSTKEQACVGQFLLDSSIGFDGTSIYCDNSYVASKIKEDWVILKLNKKVDYENHIKKILNGVELGKDKTEYRSIIARAFPYFQGQGINVIKGVVNSNKSNMTVYKTALKNDAKRYLGLKKSLVAADKIVAPPEASALIEEAKRNARFLVDDYTSKIKSFKTNHERYAQSRNDLTFMERSAADPGDDFKLVKSLLKNKLIESISYKDGKLSWVYSPRHYDPKEAGRPIIFLGRVRFFIDDKNRSFGFNFISYDLTKTTRVGTWHCYDGYTCQGSFAETIQRLMAGRRVGELILTIDAYLKSANTKSKAHDPNFSAMDIRDPQVIDDSFEVYKNNSKEKANAK